KEVAISLSVVSSVHCCMVRSGFGEPARITFISHKPALRIGSSSAEAPSTGSNVKRPSATPNETSCCFMCPASGWIVAMDGADRSVAGVHRTVIRHPAAGKENIAAIMRLHGEEFHHLA